MTFPTPPPDELTNKIRCVVTFIPVDDNAIFLSTLLGQYTNLIPPYVWEGTYEEKGNISQLWQVAYAKTLEYLESGICGEIIDEDGNMSINVNVDCGCGGGGGGCSDGCLPQTVINNYNTGTSVCVPIETSPVLPPDVPPLVPDGEGGFEIPPPIYPNDPIFDGTVEEYNQQRCITAEFAYSYVYSWVNEMKLVDNIILTASAVILALTSSGTAAVIAMLTRIAPAELLQLASAIVGLAAAVPLWDEWIDDALSVLEERKDDFICGIYDDGDTGGVTQQWIDESINDIVALWSSRPDWNQDLGQIVTDYLRLLLPATPISAWARLNNVALNFVPTYDCSTCGGGGGGDWLYDDEASVMAVGSTPLVTSVDATEFTMSGNIIPDGLVGALVARLQGYDVGMVGYDAVTFTITPSYSPVISGKRWKPEYGPEGAQFDLLTTSDALDVPYNIVIYVSGTTPPAGTWDRSYAVTREKLLPVVWYTTLAAGAIAVDINTLVENFTVYPTP